MAATKMAASKFDQLFNSAKTSAIPVTDRDDSTPGQQTPGKVGRPAGKRSNPAYRQFTAQLRVDTHTRVMAKLRETNPRPDFSNFIEELCHEWLKRS